MTEFKLVIKILRCNLRSSLRRDNLSLSLNFFLLTFGYSVKSKNIIYVRYIVELFLINDINSSVKKLIVAPSACDGSVCHA